MKSCGGTYFQVLARVVLRDLEDAEHRPSELGLDVLQARLGLGLRSSNEPMVMKVWVTADLGPEHVGLSSDAKASQLSTPTRSPPGPTTLYLSKLSGPVM